MQKKILITGVGGPTPRSFAISLKKYSKYASYEIVGTDVNKYSIGLYQRDLFDHAYVIPRADSTDYWEAISTIVKKHSIEIAIILPELEVEEWSKAKSESLKCKSLIPDNKICSLLVDKAKMTKALAPLSVVPLSFEIDKNQNCFEELFSTLQTPFWIRAASGTSGIGSLKIENEKQLIDWIKINPNVNKFLASEYLPGRNLACKMLYYHGNLIRAACGERVNYIMSKVAPSGITGNTAFGRLLNDSVIFETAKTALEYLFEQTNSPKHGFFTVDLKEDENGKPFITEINVRHVAFTQCFAAAGANFAEDTIRLLDNDPEFIRDFKLYQFPQGTAFLRDVDSLPVLINEKDLL